MNRKECKIIKKLTKKSDTVTVISQWLQHPLEKSERARLIKITQVECIRFKGHNPNPSLRGRISL